MSKLTLSNLASLENATSAVNNINNNNSAIIAALDNTISRDGSTPNSMSAQLDMNSHRIINLGAPASNNDAIRLQDITVALDPNVLGYSVTNDTDLSDDSALLVPTEHAIKTYVDTTAASAVQASISRIAVADRTALKALDTDTYKSALIYDEAGRNGEFYWDSSVLSTEVGYDTHEGVFVPPSSDTTGASGCWVRLHGDKFVSPQMFKNSDDAGDDALMLQRFFDFLTGWSGSDTLAGDRSPYTALGIIPPGTYTCNTQIEVNVSKYYQTSPKVLAYGVRFVTADDLYGLKITGGGSDGSFTIEGLTFDHRAGVAGYNTPSGGFYLHGTGNIKLIKCSCVLSTAITGYIGISLRQTDTTNSDTGCFWTHIEDFQTTASVAGALNQGISLVGAQNATRIVGGDIVNCTYGIFLNSNVSPVYGANGVLIDGVNFEGVSYAVAWRGTVDDASSRPLGLRIVNCRCESAVSGFILFQDCNEQAEWPPYMAGNVMIGSIPYVSASNATVYYNCPDLAFDLPFSMGSAATTVSVSFNTVQQPDTNYNVFAFSDDAVQLSTNTKTTASVSIDSDTAGPFNGYVRVSRSHSTG